jgi:membrane protein required for colicin V production
LSNFDYIVLGLLLLSAVLGFARGAAREVAALVALLAAAAAAIFGLKPAAAMAAHVVHPHWLAVAAAAVVVFGVVYIVLRLVGAGVARRVHGTNVGGALDRTVGLAIGLARGLVVLGALYLMFTAATPADLQPRWITRASTWPLAANMGHLLEAAEPEGLHAASRLKPLLVHAVGEPLGDRSTTEGYHARRRGEVHDLVVEKSR